MVVPLPPYDFNIYTFCRCLLLDLQIIDFSVLRKTISVCSLVHLVPINIGWNTAMWWNSLVVTISCQQDIIETPCNGMATHHVPIAG